MQSSQKYPQKSQKQYRNFTFIIFICLNGVLSTIYFGIFQGVFNVLFNPLADEIYKWSDDQKTLIEALINGLSPLGGFIGAMSAGYFASRFGRRKALLFSDFLSFVSLLLYQIQTVETLLIARFIGGISFGFIFTSQPVYLREMSPVEVTGIALGLQPFIGNLSICLGFAMGLAIPQPMGSSWRIMLALGFIPIILRVFLLIFVFKYDTPKYLIQTKKVDEAKKYLRKIYKEEYVEDNLNVLIRDNAKTEGGTSYKDLISPRFKKRFFIGLLLACFQQFVGINFVIFYSDELFRNSSNPQLFTFILGLLNTIMTLNVSLFIDKFGRKALLLVGEFIAFIGLILCTVSIDSSWENLLPLFVYLFISGMAIGLDGSQMVIITELVPEKGVGIIFALEWFNTFIVGFFFKLLKEQIGTRWVFLICDIFALISIGFTILIIKETKGLNVEEIDQLYPYEEDKYNESFDGHPQNNESLIKHSMNDDISSNYDIKQRPGIAYE